MGLAGQVDVVAIATLALYQPQIFAARHRLADAVMAGWRLAQDKPLLVWTCAFWRVLGGCGVRIISSTAAIANSIGMAAQ